MSLGLVRECVQGLSGSESGGSCGEFRSELESESGVSLG